MRSHLLAIPLAAALALLGIVSHTPRAHAQIDPLRESYGVYQRDQLVGELFREERDTSHYTEHWVLSERYVYPSERNSVTTVIRPSGRRYDGFADFAARVSWSNGSRYVESVCDDGATLPSGRVAR